MGCGCKSDNKIDSMLSQKENNTGKSVTKNVGKYILKSLAFLLMLVALPLINLYIIWLMFRMLVLNKDIEIEPLLTAIGMKFKAKDDDEEEEYAEYDYIKDDLVVVNVEDITKKSK
jgi:hypothetical protein